MVIYIDENKEPQVISTDISQIVGSVNGVAPDGKGNVTLTLDNISDGDLRKLKSFTTIYYGIGSVENDKFKISIDDFIMENIDNNMLLITYTQSVIASTEDYTENFIINGNETYKVTDNMGNNISLHDIANNNYSLFAFNGKNFVLLTKQQLIDSHVSTAKDIAPTANQVRWLYEYFKEQIGDIPAVLDFINRKVV